MATHKALQEQLLKDQGEGSRRPATESQITANNMANSHNGVGSGDGGPQSAQTMDDLKKGESNILVAVRLRPLIPKEELDGQFNLVKILDEKLVILQDP